MKRSLLAITCALFTSSSFAWGPQGHQLVGELAEKYLLDSVKIKIREISGEETLAQLSTWPDEIKADPNWAHSKPWHFANIPDGMTYDDCEKNPGGDVIEAIPRMTKDLVNTTLPMEKRKQALAFIVHFMGDIHQPLHVGKPEDLGGNAVNMDWMNKKTNLHAIWDSAILRTISENNADIITMLYNVSDQQIAQSGIDEVNTWVNEGLSLRQLVYSYPAKREPNWEKAYANKVGGILKDRLKKSSVRLASWLNKNLR